MKSNRSSLQRILPFITFALMMFSSTRSANAADNAAMVQSVPLHFRQYVLARLNYMEARQYKKPATAFINVGHIHDAAYCAADEMMAYHWTGKTWYAQRALMRIKAIVHLMAGKKTGDFFFFLPFTSAYRSLVAGGFVTPQFKRRVGAFVSHGFVVGDWDDLFNQTIWRSCGLELAAQTWPEAPNAKMWHRYAQHIYDLLAKQQDVTEDATNYYLFDLWGTFELSDLLHRPQVLHEPGIRAMFTRLRDQVSPAGFMPPYGDSGSPDRQINWPMSNLWSYYVAAFERAAKTYHDPSYCWAAQRMAAWGAKWAPLGNAYGNTADLFALGYAAKWTDRAIKPVTPKIGSQILTRRTPHNHSALDKLILAPSRQPSAPFLLADLFVRSYHAHYSQMGAIDYYEYNNLPLLTTMGYNNRGPSNVDLVMMRPAGQSFPIIPGRYPADHWNQLDIPTKLLGIPQGGGPNERTIGGSIALRVNVPKGGVVFSLGGISLRGANNAKIVLDSCQSSRGWPRLPAIKAIGPHDKPCLSWALPRQGALYLTKTGFTQTFNDRKFPILRIWWKFSNNHISVRPLIIVFKGRPGGVWIHAQLAQLAANLTQAKVEHKDGIQYGLMRYTDWFTPNTTLLRQMVVTGHGVLVVRDVLRPGPLANGMIAGPIWHLGPHVAPRTDGNWLDTTAGDQRMLVWFAPAKGRTFGDQVTAAWQIKHCWTAYARQTVRAGRRFCFVTVIVPHRPDDHAASLAAGIHVTQQANSSTIVLNLPHTHGTLRLSNDGTWRYMQVHK